MKRLLRLHAIEHDRQRIEQLSSVLTSHAYVCEVVIDAIPAPNLDATIDLSEPKLELQATHDVVCWTKDSLGDLGKDLQERARALKERNSYIGLLLDDVSPPEIVRSAQDVPLAGLEDADSARREALLAALDQRIEGADPKRQWWTVIQDTLLALHRLALRIESRLSSFKKLAIVATLSSFIGIISAVLHSQDTFCGISALHRPCRFLRLGHLPSERQQAEWDKARSGSDCKPFEAYLLAYGPHAPFAAEAQQRLNLKRDVAATYRKPLLISYSVPYADVPLGSQAAAIADLSSREASDAVTMCSRNAQAFSGEYAPGKFTPDATEPVCDQRDGGYSCRARGALQCSFLMPTTKSVCPPS